MHNARRAERAAHRAAQLMGRRLPPVYPDQYADELHVARGPAHAALMHRHTQGSLQLLGEAVRLQNRAQQATRAAIEALRWGGMTPSWADLGKMLGLSPAGAHKRYRDVEDPEPQASIDEELEEAPAA